MSQILFVAVPGGRWYGGRRSARWSSYPASTRAWAEAGMATWAPTSGRRPAGRHGDARAGDAASVTITRVPHARLTCGRRPSRRRRRSGRGASRRVRAPPRVAPTAERADLVATTYEASAGDHGGGGVGEETGTPTAGPVAGRQQPTEQVGAEPTPPFVPPDFHRRSPCCASTPRCSRRLGLSSTWSSRRVPSPRRARAPSRSSGPPTR